MFEDRYKNDPRFWLFNTTIGKWIIRLSIIGVIISIILDQFGLI